MFAPSPSTPLGAEIAMPNVPAALSKDLNADIEDTSGVIVSVHRAIWVGLALVAVVVVALRITEIHAELEAKAVARLDVSEAGRAC